MAEKTYKALAITTGAAAVLGTFAAWTLHNEWKKQQNTREQRKDLIELANNITAEDLATLAYSDNITLKRSAEQILLDRLMHEENLRFTLNKCLHHDIKEVKKAVFVLNILAKSTDCKDKLVKCGVFETLVKCLKNISEGYKYKILAIKCKENYEMEQIVGQAVIAINDLITNETVYSIWFFSCGKELVGLFLEMIGDPSNKIAGYIKRWALLIIHQLMTCDITRFDLISYGIISRTTQCFLNTFGDPWQSRPCLQILVMLHTSLQDYANQEFLEEMAQHGILPALVGCLKSDDGEVIFWSTALLQEFCSKDVHRNAISKMPGLLKTLYSVLTGSEAGIQRIIIRIYNFLCIGDSEFQEKLINFQPLMKRISICLASGNPDLVYWTIQLTHDLAMSGKSAAMRMMELNEDLVKSIVALIPPTESLSARLLGETLGFFCSCESLYSKIIQAGAVKAILWFTQIDEPDVVFWASTLLLNLSMTSDEAQEKIVRDGGVKILLEMAINDTGLKKLAYQAAKTLVMIGYSDSVVSLNLKSGRESSIIVEGKEYSPGKFGINLVTIEFSSFLIGKGRVFDVTKSDEIAALVRRIKELQHREVIILTTQGDVNRFLHGPGTTEIKAILKALGLDKYTFPHNGAWTVVSQTALHTDSTCFVFISHSKDEETDVSLPLGYIVNEIVQDNLLTPLLELLMSMPAASNISKLSELETLSILARQDFHTQAMVFTTGYLEYLAEIIWNFSCAPLDQLSNVNPLMIAHCVGAMKILHSVSINTKCRSELLNNSVIAAIVSMLLTITRTYISSFKQELAGSKPDILAVSLTSSHFRHITNSEVSDLKGEMASCREEKLPDVFYEDPGSNRKGISSHRPIERMSSSDVELVTVTPIPEEKWDDEDYDDFEEEDLPVAIGNEEEDMRAESGRFNEQSAPYTPRSRPASAYERRGRASTAMSGRTSRALSESASRAKSPLKDIAADLDDLDEALLHLSNYSIETLYHITSECTDLGTRDTIFKSGVLHLLYCMLLACERDQSAFYSLGAVSILANFVRPITGSEKDVYLFPDKQVVHVDKRKSTPAMMFSNDLFEIRNGNWTFETAVASQAVNRSYHVQDKEKPKGWYFEVSLQSSGIMQIGWVSSESSFDPTKGRGVGDECGSCGFDGLRCKVLKGRNEDDELDYGKSSLTC